MKTQQGAGLIEVLVTVLILGTSLLALAALQSKSLHYNHSAYLRSQANILAYDLLDRIRLNQGQLASYQLSAPEEGGEEPDPDGEDPTPPVPTHASGDLDQWQARLSSTLPGATGELECSTANRVCTVTISWVEQNSSGDQEEDSTTFVYSTRI